MEEVDTILAYKDSLKIIQEKDEFSFSIDSTILSFFCDVKKRTSKVVDLGTGNGAIPLFISMFTKRPIYGIEIQESSYNRAKRSVELNNLENQITIINDDIKGIHKKIGQYEFFLVISNPPYFKVNDESLRNKKEELTIARHEVKITMEDIIKEANMLLTDGGSFCMIQRTERFLETLDSLRNHNFSPKRIRFVYPKPGKDSYVFMIEALKHRSDHGLVLDEPLYIYNEDGSYSKEILEYFHYGENDEKI